MEFVIIYVADFAIPLEDFAIPMEMSRLKGLKCH